MSVAGNMNGAVTGDAVAPTLSSAFVNYRIDATGATVDIQFSEDIDGTDATDAAKYTATGSNAATSATAIRADTIRVEFASPLMTGDQVTITNISDVAGNETASDSIDALQP